MAKLMAFSVAKKAEIGERCSQRLWVQFCNQVEWAKVVQVAWRFAICECKCNFIKLNIYRLSLSKLQVN